MMWFEDLSEPKIIVKLFIIFYLSFVFYVRLPETKETPAIRSALQIHSKHIDSNHSTAGHRLMTYVT
jgi:hypothetical protein